MERKLEKLFDLLDLPAVDVNVGFIDWSWEKNFSTGIDAMDPNFALDDVSESPNYKGIA